MARRTWPGTTAMLLAVMPLATRAAEPLVRNGRFTEVREAAGPLSVDQGFGVWTGGDGIGIPNHWVLNPAYPGEIRVGDDSTVPGGRFARVRGTLPRGAHLYQPCPDLKANTWYSVSARVRGTGGRLGFYEYYPEGRILTPILITFAPRPDSWQ